MKHAVQTPKQFLLTWVLLALCGTAANAQAPVSVPAGAAAYNPPVVNTGITATPGQQFVIRVGGAVELQNDGDSIRNNAAGLLLADTLGWQAAPNGSFPMLLANQTNPTPAQVAAAGGCAPCDPAGTPVPASNEPAGALLFGQLVPGQAYLATPVRVLGAGAGTGPFVALVTASFKGTAGLQVNEWYAFNNSGAFSVEIAPLLIDITPGQLPNSINPANKGVTPVAVLTNALFDAGTVNPATVRFGASGVDAAPVQWDFADVDGDGDVDLVLRFTTLETGIKCGDTSASLTGTTFAGQSFRAFDSIVTKCGKG